MDEPEPRIIEMIYGRYDSDNPVGLGPSLELRGPFSPEAIKKIEVMGGNVPYTFSPESAERNGGATFLVTDEKSASELEDAVHKKLRGQGFVVHYCGQCPLSKNY